MPIGGFGEMRWHINAIEESQQARNNRSEVRLTSDVLTMLVVLAGAFGACVLYAAFLSWVCHLPFP